MEKYIKILETSPLFLGVEKENIQIMLTCLQAKIKHYEKDTYIFHQGESVKTLGIVLEGSVFIVQEDFWGNRNIMSSISEGQMFAESFVCVAESLMNVGVQAQKDCSILFLDVSRILTMCSSACAHHTQLLKNLLSAIALKNIQGNEKLLHVTQRSTRTKILSYLSKMAQQNNSNNFTIPFNRQQLADYLAIERSGLCIELSKMKKEGLLDYHKNYFCLNKNIKKPEISSLAQ